MRLRNFKFIFWQTLSFLLGSSKKALFISEFNQGEAGVSSGKEAVGCDGRRLVLKPLLMRAKLSPDYTKIMFISWSLSWSHKLLHWICKNTATRRPSFVGNVYKKNCRVSQCWTYLSADGGLRIVHAIIKCRFTVWSPIPAEEISAVMFRTQNTTCWNTGTLSLLANTT